MEMLPPELYFKIFNYIKPVQLLCLGKVNLMFRNLSKQYFKNFLLNFNNYGDILNKIKDLLDGNCVLSGSTMYQLLTGDRWIDSDIDIFIKLDYDEPIRKLLLYENFVLIQNTDTNYEEYGFRVDTFTKGDLKIQLILINGDPVDSIRRTFDFAFLKNYFDGNNIYYNKLVSSVLIIDCSDYLKKRSMSKLDL
jgi:hypothetical protein